MIERWSEDLTRYLVFNKYADDSIFKIVKLGIEVIISTLINLGGIILLGILFSKLGEALVFSLCFMTIRNYSGGYHAKTRICCNFSLWFITSILLLCVKFVDKGMLLFYVLGIFLSGIAFIKLGPLENRHKPLASNIKTVNRRYMLFFWGLWSCLAILMYNVNIFLTATIVLTEIVISILLVVEKGRCYYEKKCT